MEGPSVGAKMAIPERVSPKEHSPVDASGFAYDYKYADPRHCSGQGLPDQDHAHKEPCRDTNGCVSHRVTQHQALTLMACLMPGGLCTRRKTLGLQEGRATGAGYRPAAAHTARRARTRPRLETAHR